MVEYMEEDARKYALEHEECAAYQEEVVVSDKAKFEQHYLDWKEAVVRFHKLKQEDAISVFLARMNSLEFVNPKTRVAIFAEMMQEQMNLYEARSKILQELNICRPTALTSNFVSQQEEKLRQYNEESSLLLDKLVDKLAKDMENTNEDIDIAEYDLKDFLIKNDAQLKEGETFDTIMARRVKPTTDRRKFEAKTLVQNSIAYMEENDYKMGEISTNIVNFYKDFAKKLDTNKEKLK